MSTRAKAKPSQATSASEALSVALARLRTLVDARLAVLVPESSSAEEVATSMRAAATSPGKRLRPCLTLLVVEAFGGEATAHVDLACTVELVHAASLVLDDLPCMDNADLRRGRPSLHRQCGEAVAILAAFALLARAQALLLQALAASRVAPAHRTAVIGRLARVVEAMCRGQSLDLALHGAVTLASLEQVHAEKTGALFEFAAELGGVAAEVTGDRLEMLLAYARNLGLAFQVSDDLLDALGSPETLGKPAGRDGELGRATFVSVFGTDGAAALRDELLAAAAGALAPLGRRAALLEELTTHVRERAS